MKLKNGKKIISSILLLCIIITNMSSVFATQIGETKDIVNLGDCGDYITYRRNGTTMVVNTHYVGFYENGVFHPAYCLDKSLPGVEHDPYGVTVEDMNSIVNNQALWRVLVNSFPYKSPQEMGLDNEQQAFMVTKQAVYRVIDGESTDNYGALNATGEKMVAKIRELVNIGRNGTQTYQDPVINIDKLNEAGVDNKDKNYISQTFKVDSQVDMENINAILNTNSAPEGTYIGDINNNRKTQFNKGDTFKILVPRDKITKTISIQVSFDGNCKVYPILFGRAPSSSVQNYLLTTDPFILSSARTTMNYKPSIDIEIDKISSGDSELTGIKKGEGIDGTTYNVKSEDGTYNKNFVTENGGKILITGLDIKKYFVTEVKEADYFLKGKDTVAIVDPKHDGDDQKVVMENTPVDIKVSVTKDSDKQEAQGNEIVTYDVDNIKNLSNVKLSNFTLTDDLPKEVRLQTLETGTYNEDLKYNVTYSTNKKTNITLQENLSTKTNNKLDFTKIKLDKDEYVTSYSLKFGTVKIGFSNTTKMKVETKVIEGLADKSKFINNVKVSGTYLEKKTEDKDDETVKVYENILKVKKVTKEYNQYTKLDAGTPINATFELLDENKKYIKTLDVKDTQETIVKYLEIGKVYYLKEISVDPYYVINPELIEFKFEKNGQVIELAIKDDNVNLVVDVEKEAPTEAQKGEVIDYTFNHIGNFSNTKVSNFIWGDKLPRQVRVQKLQTGIWNEELDYEIQYITNKNTNWKNIEEKYKTTENNTIDLTSQTLGLEEDEYVTELRLLFGEVKSGFEATTTPIVKAKVNEDVQNNKIFVNDTYVTADYYDTKLEAKDDAHTVVYTKKPDIDKELPKTGINN